MVVDTSPSSGLAEWLTRQGSGPSSQSRSGPSGLIEGMGPHANPAKEVADIVLGEIGRSDVLDGAAINGAGGNSSSCAEFAKPRDREIRVLIVVDLSVRAG